MADIEQRLRVAMHAAVDAEEGSPGALIRQVRRRHRRHVVLAVCAAVAAVLAIAAPAEIAIHHLLSGPVPSTHHSKPSRTPLPTRLSGPPMGTSTHLRLLDVTGAWYTTGWATSRQAVTLIAGLPAPGARPDAFVRVEGGWVASSSVSPPCRGRDCAGPAKEFYFLADGSETATQIGAGYQVASASRPGALWLMKYRRPSNDIASASASAQLVSTAGLRLGARYVLPAGYLIDRGVAGYLLLSGHNGASVLWNPRTGRVIRRFADVIAAGPEQIVWTQGCRTCQAQILNLATGGTVTTRLADSQLATPDPVLSGDGKLLAVRLAHGPVGVVNTSTGALTEIPGSALGGDVSLVLGWLGEGHRLVIIIWPKADPGVIQLGYWQPGESRLTVAAPSNYGSELPDQLLP